MYKKSSFCSGGGCVEIEQSDNKVLIRNSKDPENIVEFTLEEWRCFREGVLNADYR